ncbi:MAG: hypothetical protein GY775_19240 [Candidatus Scalindua sp.]|nr:hypothetical protein [Candidatus Scalindua sp.]
MYFKTDYQGLAHHWVHNDDYSHCYSNKMFSEKEIIYSYNRSFIIAKKIQIKSEFVFLVNTETYSVTTSKQQRSVRVAIPNYYKIFNVSHIFTSEKPNPSNRCHLKNIEHYLDKIEEFAILESKAKSVDYKPKIRLWLEELKLYIKVFNPDKRRFTKTLKTLLNIDSKDDLVGLVELLTGIRNERVRAHKRAKTLAHKKALIKENLDIKKWLNYEKDRILTIYNSHNYLRLSKDKLNIEVSNGAKVSVKEAKILIHRINKGEKILGSTIESYKIVKFNNSIFQAGCTTLEKYEVNKMCSLIGEDTIFK